MPDNNNSVNLNLNTQPIQERIRRLMRNLSKGIFEKEEALRMALLSAAAGESIFLLGPPGVAKSLVARRLKYSFKNARVFEYLMSRFSTPDEIFGPVSISRLKEDKYERIIANYLPAAEVVFLDEIWKAGPSIQNALLTVINEKVFRNGDREIKIPLKALVSASNELPAKDQGLEALWDRFLVRLFVEGIRNVNSFNKMIAEDLDLYDDMVEESAKITEDEYCRWQGEISKVEIPSHIFNVIHVIRNYIDEHNASVEAKDATAEGEKSGGEDAYKNHHKQEIYVSDRRWRKIVRLLRASAFFNGRDAVDLMDCFLIRHCLWNDADQIDTIFQFVKDAVEKHGYNAASGMGAARKELTEFRNQIEAETSFVKEETIKIPEIVFRLPDTGAKGIMNREYYKIPGRSDEEGNLISKDEFSGRKGVYLGLYYEKQKGQIACAAAHDGRTRKTSGIAITIDEKEYELQCAEKTIKQTISQKPQPETKQAWDLRIDSFLEYSGGIKDLLRNSAEKEAPGLRTNLFVQSDFARFIQSHISRTRKELKQLEIEIREIQHAYKSITAGEIIK